MTKTWAHQQEFNSLVYSSTILKNISEIMMSYIKIFYKIYPKIFRKTLSTKLRLVFVKVPLRSPTNLINAPKGSR